VAEREKLKARALAEGGRSLSSWIRRKLGLPRMKDTRGRPKGPRKPKMSQLPLLPNEPPQAADAPPETAPPEKKSA
jgi:hypothetical protein